MPEAFSFIEGQLYISTGVAFVTSARIAYAEMSNLALQWGWDNRPAASGNYGDHQTGQRANFSFAAVYTYDKTAILIAEAETAIHMKLHQNTINGSAGYYLYSGRIDSLTYAGQSNGVYKYTMNGHCNSWSAY